MENLINLILGSSSSVYESAIRIVVFICIVEFIGLLFVLIGKMKG